MDYLYCTEVKITIEAYSSCINHALLTEGEEVMGLLIGNVKNEELNGSKFQIINIFCTMCLTRKCKEKDRVEFDEIQVSKASEYSDNLSKELKIDVQVVGWYHSHPKITFPPSQVDLNTQYSQQYQGPFIGLIFSCFNNDQYNCNKINTIAFQSSRDYDNYLFPKYIKIDFIEEGVFLINSKKGNITNSAISVANLLKNLVSEEEEQHLIEIDKMDKNDYLNNIVHSCNRQTLIAKIIQNIAINYNSSLLYEIENLRNYLDNLKDLKKNLNIKLKNFQEVKKNFG